MAARWVSEQIEAKQKLESSSLQDRKKFPSYGTDVMRLWAAQVDYTRDVAIGPTSLSAAAENARKIRNAIKFILGNAYRGDQEPPTLNEAQLGLVSCGWFHFCLV